MKKITDINDHRIEYYRNLRGTPSLHSKSKVFIAEGEKVVRKLLNSDIEIISVFMDSKYSAIFSQAIAARQIPGDKVLIADKGLMNLIAGFRLHQGIMAIGRQPAETHPDNFSDRIAVLNGIVNSENVGSIARNCVAFGIDALICDSDSSSQYLRRAVRVSMGAVFQLKHLHYKNNIENLIHDLKQRNYSIISSEITKTSEDVNQFKFPLKFCLIFGSEGVGICQEILSSSDAIIHINIKQAVDSLNVAVASAVILSRISDSQQIR